MLASAKVAVASITVHGEWDDVHYFHDIAIVRLATPLTLIDGVESLATAQAVDRIDPFKRKSSPDRVLRAMGYSDDVASSAIRVSLGLDTTEDDVVRFAETWLDKRQKHARRAA